MSDELAENLKRLRRAKGWSQEQLAHRAGLSVGPVRKIEQGRSGVRMETLHALARALGVRTSDLMAAGPPEPVGHEDPNSQNLRALRIALAPALGLGRAPAPVGAEPDLRRLRRMTHDSSVLYFADTYASIAAELPVLIKAADDAVAWFDSGDAHAEALVARSRVMSLVGRYLTQIRQYDLAHVAALRAIEDGRAAGDDLTAASGVGGMCWLLVRTERFDEAEDIAVATMDAVEPKIMGASDDQYATWQAKNRTSRRRTGRSSVARAPTTATATAWTWPAPTYAPATRPPRWRNWPPWTTPHPSGSATRRPPPPPSRRSPRSGAL
ncbi:helix-turn-helix domain-containing protein [Streptomyces sp. LaPpAH-108]|uniref:helix-turn-helix domain-containing protein n=1 Tax=Streptomyces sp. LaPpAH-108 TaxID=1155714 RepID=UPI0003A13CD6|nr:helix-turn-helix transcriptional regulator [Streptomyces sp. LaPpAH-108]